MLDHKLAPHYIGVQFSGKTPVYYYLCHPEDAVKVGERVVVPTSLKEDDSVSMTIATCIVRLEEPPAALNPQDLLKLKPIVQSLDPVQLAYAASELKRIAALEAPL